jgi:regulator of replication initiation timing
MARLGITQEQVNDTANTLINEGIAVTVQSLRDRLASGSFSTLSKYLSVWKTERDKTSKTTVPEPPALIEKAFKQVWAMAWQATQDEVKAERDGLETTRKQFEFEKTELLSEVTHLETQLDSKEQETEELKQLVASEQEKISVLSQDFTALQIENAGLVEKCKTLASFEAQIQHLQNQLIELAKGNKATKK